MKLAPSEKTAKKIKIEVKVKTNKLSKKDSVEMKAEDLKKELIITQKLRDEKMSWDDKTYSGLQNIDVDV